MVDIDNVRKSNNKIRAKIRDSVKDEDGSTTLTMQDMHQMLNKFKELT